LISICYYNTIIVRAYSHSDKELQYSAGYALSLVLLGSQKPNRTFDSTNFPYSDKVTKYCILVRKVLSLLLFGSIVPHYSTKVLCHYAYSPTDRALLSGSDITEAAVFPRQEPAAYKYAVQTAIRNKMKRRFHFLQRGRLVW
jgi:hypothetical protein